MFIEGCARLVVLLLLVSSSFSQSLDDTSGTLDAAVEDPVRTSDHDSSLRGVGGRLRRWNSALENALEHNRAALHEDEQRIDEDGIEGVNATGDVKESKLFFGLPPSYSLCLSQCLLQGTTTTVAPTTTAAPITSTNSGICQLLALNAGITSPTTLQAYLQQCAILIGLIAPPATVAPTTTPAPTTNTATTTPTGPTTAPPIRGICDQLAANANITAPAVQQTYVQQCLFLIGLITG